MFNIYSTPNYYPRSANEIEAEGREREKRLDLERAIERAAKAKRSKKKNILSTLASILFS